MSTSRLYSQVVERISALIESGEFAVGTRLPPERELAQRFNVSRPTVREAVIALEAVGKISVRSGSGMYVASTASLVGPSADISPFELMESRVLIEGEAAALAATLITEEQLASLAQALELMAQENAVDGLGRDCADQRFHTIIAQATKNQMLVGMIERLWDTQQGLQHIRSAHESVCKPDPEVRLSEHRAIYEALAARDSQAARAAMRRHFARAIEALHAATEEAAVAEVQRRLSRTRERFSSDRIIDSGIPRRG